VIENEKAANCYRGLARAPALHFIGQIAQAPRRLWINDLGARRRHLKTCSCIATSVWMFLNIVSPSPAGPAFAVLERRLPCAALPQRA